MTKRMIDINGKEWDVDEKYLTQPQVFNRVNKFVDDQPQQPDVREQIRDIVTRKGMSARIPEMLELELDQLEALLADQQRQQEKAYGGCHICYGKGYHTKRVGHSSRYGNKTYDTIGYCTCDRGKQLKEVMASSQRQLIDRLMEQAEGVEYPHKNYGDYEGSAVPLEVLEKIRSEL